MIWPPSVRAFLFTEVYPVTAERSATSLATVHVQVHPEFFRAETADTEKEADAWYETR